MGAVKLELRCPQAVDGIAVEPEPDWSFDALLSEINSLELKLNASSSSPITFNKTMSREFSPIRKIDMYRRSAFVMHVSDDELEDVGSDGEELHNQSIVAGRRFACDELSLSDDDCEDGTAETCLMDRVDIVEGALVELSHEHQLGVRSTSLLDD